MDDRVLATLYGTAYGDAVGFPSLFHRFHVLPAKRHDFLFNTNRQLSRERILPLALPFTHRQPESTLSPGPSDDTEYAVFTAQALIACGPRPTGQSIFAYWGEELSPRIEEIWTRFSERAALENAAHGLEPPASGNDNPLHYEDAAANRAVAIGLFCGGEPDRAAELAGEEASISQAEDGIWGAQAIAYAVAALLSSDGSRTRIDRIVEAAAALFPAQSWIAAEWAKASECAKEAKALHELALLLAKNVINNVYSFGNAAPETVPAALTLMRAAAGEMIEAVGAATLIAKAADSLPPLVGALCGAACGSSALGKLWVAELDTLRGCCLPFLKGVRLSEVARRLHSTPAR